MDPAVVAALAAMQAQVATLQARAQAGNVRLNVDHVGESASLVLDADQTNKALTLDVNNLCGCYLRKARLSAGQGLTLDNMAQCILVILDPVSSRKLEAKINVYNPADELNIDPALSTAWQDAGGHLIATELNNLYPRFVRYIIKYLFNEKLQNTVRQMYALYVSKTDLTQVSPSAIIHKLEEFRKCSFGKRAELVIPRSQVFIDFNVIM